MPDFTSVAIAVVEHDEKFLVGQRAEHVPLGGLWEFPGGKIEQDESPQDAAQRECREETGIEVVATRCLVVNLQQYDHGQIKLHFYACRLKKTGFDTPNATAYPPYHWVTRQELSELEFPVGNRAVLDQLLGR
jgi:mutator protein MutT